MIIGVHVLPAVLSGPPGAAVVAAAHGGSGEDTGRTPHTHRQKEVQTHADRG